MSTIADQTTRRFLAPDLDGELAAATEPVENLLLMIGTWADDYLEVIPPGLHRAAAAEALGELRVAVVDASCAMQPTGLRSRRSPRHLHDLTALVVVAEEAARGHAVAGDGDVGAAPAFPALLYSLCVGGPVAWVCLSTARSVLTGGAAAVSGRRTSRRRTSVGSLTGARGSGPVVVDDSGE